MIQGLPSQKNRFWNWVHDMTVYFTIVIFTKLPLSAHSEALCHGHSPALARPWGERPVVSGPPYLVLFHLQPPPTGQSCGCRQRGCPLSAVSLGLGSRDRQFLRVPSGRQLSGPGASGQRHPVRGRQAYLQHDPRPVSPHSFGLWIFTQGSLYSVTSLPKQ